MLSSLFTAITEYPISNPSELEQYYIVFVSSISQADANVIVPLINNKLKHTKLTFVALKNVNQNILGTVSPDLIDWSDMTKPEPVNWEQKFWESYGCCELVHAFYNFKVY